MTDLLTTVETGPNGGIKRDRWGRYLLPDPHTGEQKSWTRVTTLSSTLADRFGLEKWAQRNIVYGLGQRQDLYARAAAATLDDKQTLTQIVDDAQAAAADKAGANLGSAIHQFTERIDRGEKVNVPPPYDRDIDAYQQTLEAAGLAVVLGWVERVVVIPELEVVGTLDRLCEGPWSGALPRVADVKTGKDVVRWGMTEIALQLALYAHGTHWWNGTGWEPMIPVNLERAVVIHLPVGQGQCLLYEVDIAAGWEAVQLAVAVRAWRKRKDLAAQIPAIAPKDLFAGFSTADVPDGLRRIEWLQARVENIKTAGHAGRLAQLWSLHPEIPTFPKGGPRTYDDINTVVTMCDQVEMEYGLPFGPSDPTAPQATKDTIRKETKTP